MLTPISNSPRRLVLEILMPFGLIAGILLLDSLIPGSTVTPFAISIGLLVMAFYLRPATMYCWAVIYCVIIGLVLLHPEVAVRMNGGGVLSDDRLTQWLRLGHAVCTATLASLLCYFLNKLRGLLSEERDIVSRIPLPVITSDFNGNIRYANIHAVHLLGLKSQTPSGASYFDLLAPKDRHGEFIAEYFKRMEGQMIKSPFMLEHDGVPFIGSTQLLATRAPKLMLTILGIPGGELLRQEAPAE